jgi:hypothetical protein
MHCHGVEWEPLCVNAPKRIFAEAISDGCLERDTSVPAARVQPCNDVDPGIFLALAIGIR